MESWLFRLAEQVHGVWCAGVPVDTYPLPVGFVLQAWRTPAAPGQRGAGHQQLHIGQGLEFFFSNSHVVMAVHQSSPCGQWKPLEGAESVRRGNKKELVGERQLPTQ